MFQLKESIMEIKDITALSEIRLEKAKEDLSAAEELLKSGKYKVAANRSYYAAFHAMRAVLAFDKIDMKSHKGVISEFRKLYIKTDIFPKEMSKIITELFEIRTNSDYEDYYVISKKEVTEQLKNAKSFLKEIKKFLKSKKVI